MQLRTKLHNLQIIVTGLFFFFFYFLHIGTVLLIEKENTKSSLAWAIERSCPFEPRSRQYRARIRLSDPIPSPLARLAAPLRSPRPSAPRPDHTTPQISEMHAWKNKIEPSVRYRYSLIFGS